MKVLFYWVGILLGSGLHAEVAPVVQTRSLDALVGEVLAHNPEIKGVEADLAAAKGARLQAGLWKNPDLSVMMADRQVRTAGVTVKGYSDSIGLTQTFEFPGKATLRKAIADLDIKTAEIGITQFRQALAGRVRVLGYRYAFAEENREAAELAAGRARALIALLNKRPQAGLQAMFDSGALAGNLTELISTQRDLNQEALSAKAEINLLRGWPAETPLKVTVTPATPISPTDFNAFLVRSLNTSPVLQLKKVDLARNRNRVAASKLDAAPDFAIQPYYSLDSAGDHDQKIGASVTVALPVWNQNQGNIAAAKAYLVKAETTEAQARDDLQLALSRIYQTQRLISRQLQEIGPDTLPDLAQLAEFADRHYRLGAINLQTFLEAQRQYLATTRSVHQAMLDQVTADCDLRLLSGTMELTTASGVKP